MELPGRPPPIPRATYRLQLNASFGFDDAAKLVPYLADLGVSHIYASPFLMARPGSSHGYDITDHNRFNAEIGDEASFDRLVEALRAHAMGMILDFVPNHMGVGGADNPWWLDVLEWGQSSPFAQFFDIDWSPAEATLKGKVLLPFLGDHYGNVLESGLLKLRFDHERGTFSVWYWEHRFPIAVRDYAGLLREARSRLDGENETLSQLINEFSNVKPAQPAVRQQAVVHRRADELKSRLAALAAEQPSVRDAIDAVVTTINGEDGSHKEDPYERLHALLENQSYRPSYWRVATAEINYRRFFDINDLAGLRMETQELFEIVHRLIFRLIAEDKIQGLRLDHVDGLYDPADYCRRLQDRAAYLIMQAIGEQSHRPVGPEGIAAAKPRAHVFYLLVEKILARHERLREDWPVDGTTGYDFINLVNGLFVNPAAERNLTLAYHRFIGREPDFETIVITAKRQIVTGNLQSEVNVLASGLNQIAKQSRATRDYTLPGITEALVNIIAHFPVYRTYIAGDGCEGDDRRYLDWAVSQARKASTGETTIYDFIYEILTTDALKVQGRGWRPEDVLQLASKFQQATGPVTAKAVEDTAFYRYFRLVSLNEVGGEPGHFGVSSSAFHRLNQERLRNHPYSMVATATHDHKRGEDTRARINAITEVAMEWRRRVRRWAQLNQRRKHEIDDVTGPGRNDEYLFYQTVVGSWPLTIENIDDPDLGDYVDRLVGYMSKAMREAKVHTNWAHPNMAYEQAVERFVREVMDPARSNAFLQDLLQFQTRISVIGAVTGLSQTLLKLTSPGVPDIYQGTEYWDLSLVDPDNRRPVDYPLRRSTLNPRDGVLPGDLVETWKDGRIKQHVIGRTLDLRRSIPGVFSDGGYQALEVTGSQSDRVVAFQRRAGDVVVIVVAPRLVAPLLGETPHPLPPAQAWGGTAIAPAGPPENAVFRDAMTGTVRQAASSWKVAELLGEFPVALLYHAPSDPDIPALPAPGA
jgi:(1->4)-alpha-D-glucan 1-alpha-D-glucosylmutase